VDINIELNGVQRDSINVITVEDRTLIANMEREEKKNVKTLY